MGTAALYLFSILALLGGVAMVLQRNPVHAAISLLFSMLNLAAVYALLQAHLIAALQVIIYAGAIIILIVYIIMLLQIGTDDGTKAFRRSWLWALPVVVLFSLVFGSALVPLASPPAESLYAGEVPCADGTEDCEAICDDGLDTDEDGLTDCADPDCGRFELCYGTVEAVGAQLLGPYVLPFEVSSLLLLAGIVGAVLLTGRRPKEFAGPAPPVQVNPAEPDAAQPGGRIQE